MVYDLEIRMVSICSPFAALLAILPMESLIGGLGVCNSGGTEWESEKKMCLLVHL